METGQRNRLIFFFAFLPGVFFAFVAHGYIVPVWRLGYVTLAVLVLPPLTYYAILVRKLDAKIDAQVAAKLGYGFADSAPAGDLLKDFKLSNNVLGGEKINNVYSGKLGSDGPEFKMFDYVREIGSGKNAQHFPFTAISYSVHKDLPKLSILSKWWAARVELFGSIDTESDEFNKNFSVYCGSKEDMFYILQPDVMAKLIDSQKPFNYNIEMEGERLVIYTQQLPEAKLAFKDVMDGTFSEDSVNRHKLLVEDFVLRVHAVFSKVYHG